MSNEIIKTLREAFKPLLTRNTESENRWQQVLIKINENIAYENIIKESLIILSDHNWYFDSRLLSNAESLAQKALLNEIDFVDKFLTNAYKDIFAKDMFWMGTESFPERREIFDEIIFCVNNKKFYSAITMI